MEVAQEDYQIIFIEREDEASQSDQDGISVSTRFRQPVYFEENAINPLVAFMNQPIEFEQEDTSQKEALNDDTVNTVNSLTEQVNAQPSRTQPLPTAHQSAVVDTTYAIEQIIKGTLSFQEYENSRKQQLEPRLQRLMKKISSRQRRQQSRKNKELRQRKRLLEARCPKLQTIFNAIRAYFA